MCVAMNKADFKGAIAFGGEVGPTRHLLGYQNSAISYSGPNCMLLHVPMKGELRAANLIPTTHAPNFLRDMAKGLESLDPPMRGGSRGVTRSAPVVVKYGAYEVVLASSASDIYDALELVSPDKRPKINKTLLSWFDHNRPGYGFVLPCFNNAVEMANHPILVEYTPMDPERLFVPGLESHDGTPPVLGSRNHPRDFKVVFGSMLGAEVKEGRFGLDDEYLFTHSVGYTDNLGNLRELLPKQIVGFRDENIGTNSDYWASVADVRRGLNYGSLFETMPEHAEGAVRMW